MTINASKIIYSDMDPFDTDNNLKIVCFYGINFSHYSKLRKVAFAKTFPLDMLKG